MTEVKFVCSPENRPLLEAVVNAINHGEVEKFEEVLASYKAMAIYSHPRGTAPDFDALDAAEDRAKALVTFMRSRPCPTN